MFESNRPCFLLSSLSILETQEAQVIPVTWTCTLFLSGLQGSSMELVCLGATCFLFYKINTELTLLVGLHKHLKKLKLVVNCIAVSPTD